MTDRHAVLQDLVSFNLPLAQLRDALAQFSWDSEFPIVQLTVAQILAVLERHRAESLTDEDLVEWANLLEAREDLEPEAARYAEIRDFVHEMANPLLVGRDVADLANAWYTRLQAR